MKFRFSQRATFEDLEDHMCLEDTGSPPLVDVRKFFPDIEYKFASL